MAATQAKLPLPDVGVILSRPTSSRQIEDLQAIDEAEQTNLARAIAKAATESYWNEVCREAGCSWTLPDFPSRCSIAPEDGRRAKDFGCSIVDLPFAVAGHRLGSLYTSLLPKALRAKLGAYYTPPILADRLIHSVSGLRFSWETGTVLDPACGGAAFLGPVAKRLERELRSKGRSAKHICASIAERLRGFEVDPFAAWLSQVLLELSLQDTCLEAGQRLPPVVRVGDALRELPLKDQRFDLVIGNPPYGRLSLSPEMRSRYRESLHGHANLYGLFTHLAVKCAKPGGLIAYVTPASFLAGQYFKSLRSLLLSTAPPAALDFVSLRNGVFDGVLQETLLAVFRRKTGAGKASPVISTISPIEEGKDLSIEKIGRVEIQACRTGPWLLPRSQRQKKLLETAAKMPCRLSDYGFSVHTGPLVWNREREGLRCSRAPGHYPLIWAEAIRPDGKFQFRATKPNHKPYFAPGEKQKHLLIQEPCVLVQRTTAKEQKRRLVAAVLPPEFLAKYGGAVVENHVNVIKMSSSKSALSLVTLAALLNSQAMDELFRCLSGSVAVSAYELMAIPLPRPGEVMKLEKLLVGTPSQTAIESCVARLYGVEV